MNDTMPDNPRSEQPRQPAPWRRFFAETVCVLLVALLTGLVAWQVSLKPYGDRREERTNVVLFAFRAPAMFALGRGMNDFALGEIPALDAFYRGRASSVGPSSVPKDNHVWRVRDSYQYMHYNLLYAIGWAWRLLGISVWSLHVLCAVLFAALMAALYGLFRQAMGRILSVLMVVLLSTAPGYLFECPSLRDFGKAPFMIGFFLIAAVLLRRRHSGPALLAWSVLAGIVAGTGYGFRQDLLTCLPAAMLLILVFARVLAARPLRWRGVSALCALLAFGAAGWAPIYGTWKDNGSASAQALVQGASDKAEGRMDFGRASYVMHYGYADIFDFTIVRAFADRIGDRTPIPGHFTAQHGRMGKKWFREEAAEYPADVFSRGIASALMVPKIPSLAPAELYAFDVPHQASIGRLAPLHRALSAHFAAWGLCYALAGLALFAYYDLRAATGAALLFVWFGALPGLLFEFRHFFHLTFVPYFIAAALAAWVTRRLWRAVRRMGPDCADASGAGRLRRLAGALLLPAALVSGLALTLAVLWQVQTVTVSRMLSKYEQATLEPVPFHEEARGAEILLRPDGPLPGLAATDTLQPFETCGEYLALDLDYDGKATPLRVVYECPDSVDFTHTMEPRIDYPGHPCRVRLFFPVYQTVWGSDNGPARGNFVGIAVPLARRATVHGLHRVANGTDFALWPYVTLPAEGSLFTGRKSGPHDRAAANLGNFLRARLGGSPEGRVDAEIALAKAYPGYLPRLSEGASTEDETYERWKRAVQRVPALAPRAAEALARFLPAPSAPDPAAELRVRQRIGELMPEDHFARVRAARLQMELGDPAAAAAAARAVLLEAPDYAFAARTLNEAFAAMNAPEQRLAVWRELHAASPAAVLPALHLARALFDAGRAEEGLPLLEGLSDGSAVEPEALLDWGGVLAAYGRVEQGMALVDRAVGAAAHLAEQAATRCADAAEARHRAGDGAAAIALCARAQSLAPDNFGFTLRLGELRAAAGDDGGALAEFRRILEKAPESPKTAALLDAVLDRQGDPAARVEEWRRWAERHPGASVPQLHLRRALEALGDTVGAEAACREVLQAHPDWQETRIQLGALTAARGDAEGGLRLVDEAVAAVPGLAGPAAEACVRAAKARAAAGDLPAALALLRRARGLSPTDLRWRVALGETLEAAGDDAGALDEYRAVVSEVPESPKSSARMDAILEKRGDKTAWVAEWRRIAEAHPEAALPQLHLGLALEAAGDLPGARAAFAGALDRDPGLAEARAALDRAGAEKAGGN